MANAKKHGFILHAEEWEVCRATLSPQQLADALFPVLDACLLAADPTEAAKPALGNLASRIFWERNRRDHESYEASRDAAEERKRRYRERNAMERNGTPRNALERLGTVGNAGNALERLGTVGNAGNAHYTYTNTNTNTNTDKYTNPNPNMDLGGAGGSAPVGFGLAKKSKSVDNSVDNAVIAKINEFDRALNSAGEEAFFDPAFDVATVCAAVTGKRDAPQLWRKYAAAKGEAAVRAECFEFRRELENGERVRNRGAALNARLKRLPTAKEEN